MGRFPNCLSPELRRLGVRCVWRRAVLKSAWQAELRRSRGLAIPGTTSASSSTTTVSEVPPAAGGPRPGPRRPGAAGCAVAAPARASSAGPRPAPRRLFRRRAARALIRSRRASHPTRGDRARVCKYRQAPALTRGGLGKLVARYLPPPNSRGQWGVLALADGPRLNWRTPSAESPWNRCP